MIKERDDESGNEIKRIVILGHSGFVGNRLYTFFKEKYPQKEIVGFSSDDVDLTSVKDVHKLEECFDLNTVVIMCSGIKCNYGNDLEICMKNIAMAQNVCHVLSNHPVKRFIFFSSIVVYGVNVHNEGISEETPVRADTYYGVSKHTSEELLKLEFSKLSKHQESSLVILRIPIIYGPGEKIIASTPSGFLITYLNGGEVSIWGDGSEIREFLFIEDLIKIVDQLLTNFFSGILNPSSGVGHSYKESLDVISELLGREPKVNARERTKEKVDKVYNTQLFKRIFPDFSFTPLQKGLQLILESKGAKRVVCNLCGKKTVAEKISLGEQPASNHFLKTTSEEGKKFTLSFGQCQQCGLIQLCDKLPAKELVPQYDWITYMEPEEHLDKLAERIKQLPGLSLGSKILGVTFKDESLVHRMKQLGFSNASVIDIKVDLGIDTPHIGVETIQGSFTVQKAKKIIETNGKYDVVIVRHILEHAYDFQEFMTALRMLLNDGGYVVSEAPDFSSSCMVNNYPLIWEEHVSYFTPETFKLAHRVWGFDIVHFENYFYPLEGSLIVIGRKRELDHKETEGIKREIVVQEINNLNEFSEQFKKRYPLIQKAIEQLCKDGKKITVLGAGHLSCAFINYFGLEEYISWVIDDNPHKKGLYMPGSKQEIRSSDSLADADVCFLGVNPRTEEAVCKKNQKFIDKGGVFYSIFAGSSRTLPLNESKAMFKLAGTSTEVFLAEDAIIKIRKSDILFLKEKAMRSEKKRARICFHKNNDDKVHEMLICARNGGYIMPHKHLSKSESFIVVEGEMDVVIFNDNGKIREVIEMSSYNSSKNFYYRLSNSSYHTVVVKSEFAIFCEVTNGPFSPEETENAQWAPKENDSERIQELVKRIDEFKKGNKMKNCIKRTTCRLCKSKNVNLRVPIAATPVGGAFVTRDLLGKMQDCYPLDLYQCADCGHVQLLDVVNPKILFSNYSYFSGRTGLVKHFAEYSEEIIKKNNLNEHSFIVDIGSNDGAFLRFFKERGIKVLGVDLAENIVKFANASGIKTILKMFNEETAAEILKEYGSANVVTANNVFAHVDDLASVARGVKKLLAEDGVFSFEVSYLVDVVDRMLLGAIFHEHLCYHTIKPLVSFLKREGLELIDVERVPIQGGSIICTAQHMGGKRSVSPSVHELIELEESKNVYKPEYLESFAKRLEKIRYDVTHLLKELDVKGKNIAAFGAARGGTLLTSLFEIGKHIKYIIDEDPNKQNLFSPGYHIPVLSTQTMYERNPDYVIILAWVYSKEIIDKHREYLKRGGHFITLFPEVKVIQNDK